MDTLTAPTTQSEQPPPPLTASLSRRYACDRCRSHKLRCNRDLMTSTNSPCQRCRKARVKCTIGASIRVGLSPEELKNGENVHRASPGRSAGSHRTASTPSNHAPRSHGRTFTPESAHQAPPYPSNRSMSGSMRLSPVPWLDMISFDGAQELNFDGSTSGLPMGSHTNGSGPLHAPMGGSTSSNTSSTFLDVRPPLHTPASSKPQQEAWRTGDDSTDLRLLSQIPRTRGGGVTDPAAGLTQQHPAGVTSSAPLVSHDHAFAPPQTSIISEPIPGDDLPAGGRPPTWFPARSRAGSTPSPTELKDACIQKLSDLSASLMKDLDLIITCKTASSFLFTPSDKTAAGYLFKTLDGSMTEDNAVARMLYGSERFLDIIKLFNQLPSLPSSSLSMPAAAAAAAAAASYGSTRPVDSDDAYYYSDLEDTGDIRSRNPTPEDRGNEQWSILQAYLGRAGQGPPMGPSQGSSSRSTTTNCSSSFVEVQKPDVPSILVILSCYTCLLKIYETVFFVIQHVLECSPANPSGTTDIPHTVRDLNINGFFLQNHRTLQIKILIQVSTYMLDSIQKSLGTILSDSMFQALLKTLMKEEGCTITSQGEETGMQGVRDLIRRVEEMLA
uniref:Transcription factor ffsR n=1 Tax=Aspergillus flavipes TaxID=41900 RepID=FFSR_ASPFV|nr:RecName: Full=Transcription factor ffsR; AltName: Full=Cytochalasans biosynthesis cluster protein ffsR [Aspergillus flavipes]QOG08942.1 FfsR [Aspergillus flavipes]